MIQTLDPLRSYVAPFETFLEEQRYSAPWLSALRWAALQRFLDLGFPTRHDEEWRFTNPAPILEKPFQLADWDADQEWVRDNFETFRNFVSPFLMPDMQTHTLVLFHGSYKRPLEALYSPPPVESGLVVAPISSILWGGESEHRENLEKHLAQYADFQSHAFTALNTAYVADGAYVYIPRGMVVETPIHIVYASHASETPAISHPRTLVIAEENSQATLIESYVGMDGGVYMTNAVTEVVLGANAVLDHYKVNQENRQAFHIATMQVRLRRDSNFRAHSLTLGGGFVRNEVNAYMGGENAECTLNGLYLADGQRLVDNHTIIDHAFPHCDSHELYKGILDGRAHGVFNGKIYVRLDAQKTDAKQTNKTLLLSKEAQIDTKPQLEILADDVKCTHGATVGQLDANQIFYLRSRGIPETEARNLLIYAFAGDIIQRIRIEPLRGRLHAALLAQLPK